MVLSVPFYGSLEYSQANLQILIEENVQSSACRATSLFCEDILSICHEYLKSEYPFKRKIVCHAEYFPLGIVRGLLHKEDVLSWSELNDGLLPGASLCLLHLPIRGPCSPFLAFVGRHSAWLLIMLPCPWTGLALLIHSYRLGQGLLSMDPIAWTPCLHATYAVDINDVSLFLLYLGKGLVLIFQKDLTEPLELSLFGNLEICYRKLMFKRKIPV